MVKLRTTTKAHGRSRMHCTQGLAACSLSSAEVTCLATRGDDQSVATGVRRLRTNVRSVLDLELLLG